MILAQVLGPVVSTQKHKSFQNRRILMIQPIDHHARKTGPAMLAFDDDIGAGPGDQVLICREGGSCRQIWNDNLAPVNSVIVGIIDHVDS